MQGEGWAARGRTHSPLLHTDSAARHSPGGGPPMHGDSSAAGTTSQSPAPSHCATWHSGTPSRVQGSAAAAFSATHSPALHTGPAWQAPRVRLSSVHGRASSCTAMHAPAPSHRRSNKVVLSAAHLQVLVRAHLVDLSVGGAQGRGVYRPNLKAPECIVNGIHRHHLLTDTRRVGGGAHVDAAHVLPSCTSKLSFSRKLPP